MMPPIASELTRCRGWSPEKAGEPVDQARTRTSKINDLRSKLQRVKLDAQQIIADKQLEFLKQREELERNHENAMFQLQLEENRCKEFYRMRRDELINESTKECSGKSHLSTHNYENGWQEQQRMRQTVFTYDTPRTCQSSCLQLANLKERESVQERSVQHMNRQRQNREDSRLPEILTATEHQIIAYKALEDGKAGMKAEVTGGLDYFRFRWSVLRRNDLRKPSPGFWLCVK
ncbi:hypothetical protein quinque_000090 [Culex quinquefasciatus]